jgi:hypothetical protein
MPLATRSLSDPVSAKRSLPRSRSSSPSGFPKRHKKQQQDLLVDPEELDKESMESSLENELDLLCITSKYDPFDNSPVSCGQRYPSLSGSMLIAQLRRLYVTHKKVTLKWFTPSGKRALLRHVFGNLKLLVPTPTCKHIWVGGLERLFRLGF